VVGGGLPASLCRQVSDSIAWRRFRRIGLDGSVPYPTTLMKLTTRCGSAAVDVIPHHHDLTSRNTRPASGKVAARPPRGKGPGRSRGPDPRGAGEYAAKTLRSPNSKGNHTSGHHDNGIIALCAEMLQ